MTVRQIRSEPVTRRHALRQPGAAGVGAATAPTLVSKLLAASSQGGQLTFPDGAVIRTLVGDVGPEACRRATRHG